MTVGGSNITVGGAGSSVASLNNVLKGVGVSVGAILIVIAVIKLIFSIAEENSSEKVKASMMLGVGVFFVSITAVLSALGVESITSTTGVNSVAAKILTVIGTMINYGGATLILMGIIANIVSIQTENADEQVKAVKLIASGVGGISAGGLCTYIKGLVTAGNTNAYSYVDGGIAWICSIMTYAGAGVLIVAVFRLVNAIRNEESKERNQSARLFLVAIALLSLSGILRLMGFSV